MGERERGVDREYTSQSTCAGKIALLAGAEQGVDEALAWWDMRWRQ